MSIYNKRIMWPLLLSAVALTGALTFSFARVRAKLRGQPPAMQQRTRARLERPNLSLQPEAFRLARRLGRRFTNARQEVSILNGTLMTAGERLPVQIIRRQSQRGEQVEMSLNAEARSLTWSREAGEIASVNAGSEDERKLLERLVLDSADEFVLAQLRGASYYTIARNVRPPEAAQSDDYSGPLWDIVRVDELSAAGQKEAPDYRLYYINTVTGLIEKIACETGGERIEANFFDWKELNGETVPLGIVWQTDGKTLMEFRLTNFVHQPQ
jgi:hypothetical protein